MRCANCGGSWSRATRMEPAEHCDCGQDIPMPSNRDPLPADHEPSEDDLEERR